ncbi:P-loop NTPase family protein [Azospirillum canadense]|uniref:hypothetical protein n=1 Tax=Azospirillum canadense TaxID=403962 RepID=UPI0029CAC407|nr:hypothetical protein [Azospirillum canadense]
MKMMLGLVRPDGGEVRVLGGGKRPKGKAARRIVCYGPQAMPNPRRRWPEAHVVFRREQHARNAMTGRRRYAAADLDQNRGG